MGYSRVDTLSIPRPVSKPAPERFLSLFTNIRAGETTTALILAVNVFLLLGTYYLLKTVRESLILSENGAEIKSYAAAAQAALLLVIVPLYGKLGTKVNRVKLIGWVTGFFILNLIAFSAVGNAGRHVGVAFYIWLGIFNVLVIAQFWAFANDIYTEEQGKRLFPMIGVGGALGAWLGAAWSGHLFRAVGPNMVMLIGAVGLLICVALTVLVNARERTNADAVRASRSEERLGAEGGFRLVLANRYLRLIAILVVLENVVNSVGEYLFGRLVVHHAEAIVGAGPQTKPMIASMYAGYFSWFNLIGLLMQLFLVSRLFRWVGVRGALFFLPSVSLASYSLVSLFPFLNVVKFGKIIENSTDYSVQNTTRQGLYLPTSREAKYKAKAAIDTFFWRVGDLLQAGIVLLGTLLAIGVRGYALVNVGLAVLWLLIAAAIRGEGKRRYGIAAIP